MRKFLAAAAAMLLFAGIVYGQTLEKGGVLALHHYQFTLNTGVTIDQYFDFLSDKLMPEMQKVFKTKYPFKILKGIGENNQHEYAMVSYYDSLEVFRSYWNDDGTPTEKGAAAMAKVSPLIEQLNAMGTYTMVPGDWLILDR